LGFRVEGYKSLVIQYTCSACVDSPFLSLVRRRFEISLSTDTDPVYGETDDCAEFDQCSGHGACENRTCVCAAPYSGSSCSLRAYCFFYNESAAVYETGGCTTLDTPDGGDSSTLYCACTHLTDFAGIQVATSAEELQADAAGVTVNTFRLNGG
jgi:hypothetical protein